MTAEIMDTGLERSEKTLKGQMSPKDLLSLTTEIAERIAKGERVRRTLPGPGRIHLDRPLPVLVLHRLVGNESSSEQLVSSEAAYIYVTGDKRYQKAVAELVRTVVRSVQPNYEQILIVEVWERPDGHDPIAVKDTVPKAPGFRLYVNEGTIDDPYPLLEAFENQLKLLKVQGQVAVVEQVDDPKRYPKRVKPVLSEREAAELSCLLVGVEVEPIFRDADGAVFPAVFRAVRTGLARALKHLFYRFAQKHTTLSPKSYNSMGRRAVVKATWDVDAKLDRISTSFDFLSCVTPINGEAAWNAFRKSRFEKQPALRYRSLPIDPNLEKRALFAVPVERIEDPTLADLFREKVGELDRQLTMLADRNTNRFLFGSIQLYGFIRPGLLRSAEEILERLPSTGGDASGRRVSADEFEARARAEFDAYARVWPGFDPRLEQSTSASSLTVSSGCLYIPSRLKVRQGRVEALIHHEIGTHVLTYFNGKAQRFTQLRTGLAGYEELQEGLAVLAEFLVGGMTRQRLRVLAGRVIAAKMLMDGATFVDTFRVLCRYGFTQRSAFDLTLRIYRGGGLTKDVIYLRGLSALLDYVQKGGELDPLYVGKIAIKHVSVVRELESRGVITAPKLRPFALDGEERRERLDRVRAGIPLYDLAGP